jgi:hypothetical protein
LNVSKESAWKNWERGRKPLNQNLKDKGDVKMIMKNRLLVCAWMVAITLFGFVHGEAGEYQLLGKPFTLLGYVTQGAAYGLHNDYDTQHGIQSALTNFFVEAQLRPSQDAQLYTSLRYTYDLGYDLNRNNRDWNDKLFYASRPRMGSDDNYWQVLNELHATWRPGNFLFRAGKQIVVWGEMDGFRIMDQINPLDVRRGFADVEFENTLIPIWLLKSEYSPKLQTTWLQDLMLEFTFNPNADFITDQNPLLGNDDGGIWNPTVKFPDPTSPTGIARLGSAYYNIDKPNRFSYDGFEYAFRAKGMIKDTIVSLNYFYGVENSPVMKYTGPPETVTTTKDGTPLLHFRLDAAYKPLHFVGVTASRDIPFLKSYALGGVAPVVRLETFYAFDTYFETNFSNGAAVDEFKKSDELRSGLGVDWKIKVPVLNPRAYFTISPQVAYRHVYGLPAAAQWVDSAQTLLQKDNVSTSLLLSTSYFNAKLVPSVFWLHDHVWDSNFYRFQVTYDYSSSWRFTMGAVFLDGNKTNYGFESFANKDYVFGKLQYKFQ